MVVVVVGVVVGMGFVVVVVVVDVVVVVVILGGLVTSGITFLVLSFGRGKKTRKLYISKRETLYKNRDFKPRLQNISFLHISLHDN